MRRPVEPSIPCTSLPQMPQASTRTRTSPGPVVGSGISTISSWLYADSSNDFIIHQAKTETGLHIAQINGGAKAGERVAGGNELVSDVAFKIGRGNGPHNTVPLYFLRAVK